MKEINCTNRCFFAALRLLVLLPATALAGGSEKPIDPA